MIINVAYIIPSLNIGGSEMKVIELAKGLDKKKFNPIIITITETGILEDYALNNNVPVFSVNKKNKFDIFVVRRIKKLLKNNNIHIIQTFTSTGKLWGRLSAGRKQKVISTEESLFRNTLFDRFLEKFFSRKTDLIICNSISTLESALNATKINSSKYKVIYNGIDLSRFKVRNTTNVPIKFITVARLDKRKGIDLLVEALRLVSESGYNYSIDIVGSGPEEENIINLINNYNLNNNIKLIGFRSDIPDLLQKSDVFILPSREEGFGNAVIEAFASKVPVIVSDAGGLKEVVTNEENGLVFESGDYIILSKQIIKMIENEKLRDSLSETAYLEIDKYSLTVMVKNHEKEYNELMGEGK